MITHSFTCLIPAYNEAARIGPVLDAVLGHADLTHVIVIDDGSTDDTQAIARAKGAQVIRTPGNLGKTRALALGLQAVQTSHVVLIDADLIGLTGQALTALIDTDLTQLNSQLRELGVDIIGAGGWRDGMNVA